MPNILHAADFYNKSNTGITFAITSLIEQCLLLNKEAKYGLASIGEVDVRAPQGITREATPLGGNRFLRSWRYSPGYADAVRRLIRSGDASVVHVHGAWMYPQYAAVRVAKEENVPVILTHHGLLERWALQAPSRLGALKKRTYLNIMDWPLFRKVDVFHAISRRNREMLRELFPWGRIEYIPNSVDLEAIDQTAGGYRRSGNIEPYILYVGRLAPGKGVDLLIKAFGSADMRPGYKLILVGPIESESYGAHLRHLISISPRRDQIEWRGPIWDEAEKLRLMTDAWLVSMPSFSEALGLVNLEASACRTPTITTFSTGLSDWEDGGGILIEPEVAALKWALSDAMVWDDAERKQRGEASRRLVAERYSTGVTAGRWMELYASLA